MPPKFLLKTVFLDHCHGELLVEVLWIHSTILSLVSAIEIIARSHTLSVLIILVLMLVITLDLRTLRWFHCVFSLAKVGSLLLIVGCCTWYLSPWCLAGVEHVMMSYTFTTTSYIFLLIDSSFRVWSICHLSIWLPTLTILIISFFIDETHLRWEGNSSLRHWPCRLGCRCPNNALAFSFLLLFFVVWLPSNFPLVLATFLFSLFLNISIPDRHI